MNNNRPELEERYTNGTDVVNYIVYRSTTVPGNVQVLQHKLLGTTETAHITLHANGSVNLREKLPGSPLATLVKTNMHGFRPPPSKRLQEFLRTVRDEI